MHMSVLLRAFIESIARLLRSRDSFKKVDLCAEKLKIFILVPEICLSSETLKSKS